MKMTIKTLGVIALSLTLVGCGKKKDKPTEQTKTPTTATKTAPATKATPVAAKPKPRVTAPNKTERDFLVHTMDSAPVESLPSLEWMMTNFKFIPNLAAVMAESPALLNSYSTLQQNLQKIGSLTPPEDNIIQMSIAMENECQYCVAGHTMAGKMFFKSPDAQLEAIRTKAKLPEAKLNALRDFSMQVYESKGRVTDAQLKAFLDAGYSRKQALDVVANIAAKVMTNFTNQIARTPIDAAMKPMAKGLPFAEDRKLVKNN